MADLELLLPRASAPIAGNLPPTREFYDFLRALIELAGEQVSDSESIAALALRVAALEASGGLSAIIGGQGSINVTGTLAGGGVFIELQGDSETPDPSNYYGTDATGAKGWYLRDLATLADVDLTGLVDGDALIWDAGPARFIRRAKEDAFTKGDLIAGTNVSFSGSGVARLVGGASLTVNGSGGTQSFTRITPIGDVRITADGDIRITN